MVTFPNSASVKVVSNSSEAPLASVIEPVLLKVASITTSSPFEMTRVPELANVASAMISAPLLEAAVIVPLLVREPLPLIWR